MLGTLLRVYAFATHLPALLHSALKSARIFKRNLFDIAKTTANATFRNSSNCNTKGFGIVSFIFVHTWVPRRPTECLFDYWLTVWRTYEACRYISVLLRVCICSTRIYEFLVCCVFAFSKHFSISHNNANKRYESQRVKQAESGTVRECERE